MAYAPNSSGSGAAQPRRPAAALCVGLAATGLVLWAQWLVRGGGLSWSTGVSGERRSPAPPFTQVPVLGVQDVWELEGALEHAMSLGTPVVLRGGVAHWGALKEWGVDRFAGVLQQACKPEAWVSLQTSVVEQDRGAGVYADVPMQVFAQWLREQEEQGAAGGGRLYLSEMDDIDELCPGLMEHLDQLEPFASILPWGGLLPWGLGDRISEIMGWDVEEAAGLYAPLYPVLWLGPNGTRTGLHADIEFFNLLGQVRAVPRASRVILLSSEDTTSGHVV
jgi:hypothetical protein